MYLVGYSSTQKWYKCWSPSERCLFLSMDVTFRESKPFYGENTNLCSLFYDLDSPSMGGDGREGENDGDGERGRMKLHKLDKVIIKQGN